MPLSVSPSSGAPPEPAWKRKLREQEAAAKAVKEAAENAASTAFSVAAALPGKCVHLSGAKALGDTIASIVAQRPPDELTLLVFDFDKTLTNGYASPDATIEKRVRGAKHTTDALRATLSTWGVQRLVLTARPPSRSTLEAIIVQLTGAMELGDCFDTTASPAEQEPLEYGASRVKLAHSASLYASGYEKPTGVSHIVLGACQAALGAVPPAFERTSFPTAAAFEEWRASQPSSLAARPSPKVAVHFFDDSVANAHRVATEVVLPSAAVPGMVAEAPSEWRVSLTSYWWDLHQEEFEEHSIAPGRPDSDFAYVHASGESKAGPPFLYQAALSAYGLSEADASARAQRYTK